jgi:hypothetical protein
MKPMDFRDRWVLVTGASSGLGRAMAVELARKHGARIVAVARRGERLAELQREVDARGGQVATIVADLSRMEEVDRALEEADQGGRLYAAILNAGVTHFGPYQELAWPDFEAMLNTNVRGVVRLATQMIPRLEQRETGGGLMLVSSLTGLTPVPYQTAYSATKAFLATFGAGLWHELRGKDVSVTTYAPGGIATEQTAGAVPETEGHLRAGDHLSVRPPAAAPFAPALGGGRDRRGLPPRLGKKPPRLENRLVAQRLAHTLGEPFEWLITHRVTCAFFCALSRHRSL